MIPVLDLLEDIKNKLNKNSVLEGQFIPDELAIDVLNRMQIKLILKKLGLNNNYQLGLDSFKKRYEDLQILITPYEKLSTAPQGDVFNSYKSDLSTLSHKYFLPVDAYILADKDCCKNRIMSVRSMVRHGDLQIILKSPHTIPSFKYQETVSTVSENNFYVYSDKNNSFKINDLYISYLRYPREIDISGYIHLDNTPSANSDCELDSYLEDELVNLAVEELARNTGNQELAQYQAMKNKESE